MTRGIRAGRPAPCTPTCLPPCGCGSRAPPGQQGQGQGQTSAGRVGPGESAWLPASSPEDPDPGAPSRLPAPRGAPTPELPSCTPHPAPSQSSVGSKLPRTKQDLLGVWMGSEGERAQDLPC